MRSQLLRALWLLCFVLVGSCGQKDDSDLTVSLKSDQVILINTGGKSCTLQLQDPTATADLSPVKAIVGSVSLNWSGEEAFELLYLKFTFLTVGDSNENYSTEISGVDMGYLFNEAPGAVTLAANSAKTSTTDCSLEIGGIGILNKSVSRSGQGSVLAYGITTKDGKVEAVTAQSYFSYQFDGIQ